MVTLIPRVLERLRTAFRRRTFVARGKPEFDNQKAAAGIETTRAPRLSPKLRKRRRQENDGDREITKVAAVGHKDLKICQA